MGRTWVPISWKKKNLKVYRNGRKDAKVLFKPAQMYNMYDD